MYVYMYMYICMYIYIYIYIFIYIYDANDIIQLAVNTYFGKHLQIVTAEFWLVETVQMVRIFYF